jgi:peptide/nickel transport system substrate-binding protein/oligopeptide transport system substrate-binding protein
LQGQLKERVHPRCVNPALACVLSVALVITLGCTTQSGTGRSATVNEAIPGGVLRTVQEAPRSLDPAWVDSVYESLPVNQIFDGLVSLDPSLHVVPALASTWTISRDGLVYTFHLRPGVRFHDGTPLAADDVVFTFRRVLAPERAGDSLVFAYLQGIEGAEAFAAGDRGDLPGVRALDPRTVQISLIRPYLSFLEVMTMDGLRVVPRKVVERIGDEAFGRNPVGTGPFRLAGWRADGLDLEANRAYFGGAPHLEGVHISFLRDDEFDFGAERYFRGELDLVEPTKEYRERLDDRADTRLYRYQELNLSFLGLLTTTPPLDDWRIRRAVALAIDRDAVASQSPAARRAAKGILPPGMPGYTPRPSGASHDPDLARRFLAEAGYPGGEGLPPIEILNTGRSPAANLLLDHLKADLSAVGIRLQATDVTWVELSRRIDERSAPAFLLAWIADLPDPDSFLAAMFEPDGSANWFAFVDGRTSALLARGEREMNPVERARIYHEAEERILELAPMVPLYHTVGLLALRESVRGFEPGPLGIASVDMERVWFSRPGHGS